MNTTAKSASVQSNVPTKSIFQKMASVQYAVATSVSKESVNPHFKSKYANLEDIMKALLPHLEENKLYVTTTVSCDAITTHVIDTESGDTREYVLSMGTLFSGKPQEFGSLVTYYRRYQICGIFGIAPTDDDDDGNSANNATTKSVTFSTPYRTQNIVTKNVVPSALDKAIEFVKAYKITQEDVTTGIDALITEFSDPFAFRGIPKKPEKTNEYFFNVFLPLLERDGVIDEMYK